MLCFAEVFPPAEVVADFFVEVVFEFEFEAEEDTAEVVEVSEDVEVVEFSVSPVSCAFWEVSEFSVTVWELELSGLLSFFLSEQEKELTVSRRARTADKYFFIRNTSLLFGICWGFGMWGALPPTPPLERLGAGGVAP